jgi:hypothetical protein
VNPAVEGVWGCQEVAKLAMALSSTTLTSARSTVWVQSGNRRVQARC